MRLEINPKPFLGIADHAAYMRKNLENGYFMFVGTLIKNSIAR
jgi:hypothetical protein